MLQSHRQNPNNSLISSFANSIEQRSEKNITKNHFLLNGSTFYSTAAASQTQSQIYSHSLIRQIMEQRQRNTIRHDINKINQNNPLYKLPLKIDPKQFQFDAIPPENQLFSSLCSITIKNINQGIKSQRVRHSHLNNDKILKKSGQTAANSITRNPRISASGLATFNFNSVKAQKSLGIGRINYQQKMCIQLQQNKRRLSCASQRNNRILQRRTSDHRYKSKIKRQHQIMGITNESTDKYLTNVQKSKVQSCKIYNENLKKINFIKQYMQRQKVDYEQAAHAINVIEQLTKVKDPPKEKAVKRPINMDQLFEKRRVPIKRKSVHVRNFYFIE